MVSGTPLCDRRTLNRPAGTDQDSEPTGTPVVLATMIVIGINMIAVARREADHLTVIMVVVLPMVMPVQAIRYREREIRKTHIQLDSNDTAYC